MLWWRTGPAPLHSQSVDLPHGHCMDDCDLFPFKMFAQSLAVEDGPECQHNWCHHAGKLCYDEHNCIRKHDVLCTPEWFLQFGEVFQRYLWWVRTNGYDCCRRVLALRLRHWFLGGCYLCHHCLTLLECQADEEPDSVFQLPNQAISLGQVVVWNSVDPSWPIDVLSGDVCYRLSGRASLYEFSDPEHLHCDPGNSPTMESATAELDGPVHFDLARPDNTDVWARYPQ
mmetsp:Transcript_23900/g.49595  ORF Transcript_23900/g.49595 Transcript_23900/m.49595 type:complete len:228 (-) Transcript_23900:656-1339(-)